MCASLGVKHAHVLDLGCISYVTHLCLSLMQANNCADCLVCLCRAIGGDINHDGDFLVFESNHFRNGFMYKSFGMGAIVSHSEDTPYSRCSAHSMIRSKGSFYPFRHFMS